MGALTTDWEPESGHTIERVSPVDGKAVSTVAALDRETCSRLAMRAAAAFPEWSSTPTAERAARLMALADTLEAHGDELCSAMVQEIGAPIAWARHNVSFSAEILREVTTYADDVDKIETIPDRRGITSRTQRTACGVCLGIAPWNAPLILGVRSLAAPLLCGNTVLLKGSEFAPRTYQLLGTFLNTAGIPEDVARVILTQAEESEAIVEALVASPVVRRVNFTGSTRVGRKVAEICAKHLKRPLLELGGQSTMVVLKDADLDLAAEAATTGAYRNQGQICMSTERLIVSEAVADELIARIEAARKKLVLGNPEAPETDVGPVVSFEAAGRLSALIGDAVSNGAVLVGGGGVRDAYFEPTLLDQVEPDMRLYREEVFGPILSVTRVANDQEAVTVANDSEYGLAASVFGTDLAHAKAVAGQIHSGICHINRPTVDDNPHAPFGGVKSSGYGRFGGKWAIDEFTELRWMTSAAT